MTLFTEALEAAHTAAIAELADTVRAILPTAVAVLVNDLTGDGDEASVWSALAVILADGNRLIIPSLGVGLPEDANGEEIIDPSGITVADGIGWAGVAEIIHDGTRGPMTDLADHFGDRYGYGSRIDLPAGGPDATPDTGNDDGPVERRAVEFDINGLSDRQREALTERATGGMGGDVIDGVYVRGAWADGVWLRIHEEFAADWPAADGDGVDWDGVLLALAVADFAPLYGPVRAAVDGGYDHVHLTVDGPPAPEPRPPATISRHAVRTMVEVSVDGAGDTVAALVGRLHAGGSVEILPGVWVDADDVTADSQGDVDPADASVWLDLHDGRTAIGASGEWAALTTLLAASRRCGADLALFGAADGDTDAVHIYLDATVELTAADIAVLHDRTGRMVAAGLWIDGISPLDGAAVYLTVDGPDIAEGMAALAAAGADRLFAVVALAVTRGCSTVRLTITTPDGRPWTAQDTAMAGQPVGEGMWRIACRDADDGGMLWWSNSAGWGTDDGTWATRYTDDEHAGLRLPMPDGTGPVWWVPDAPTGRQATKAIRLLVDTFGIGRRKAGQIITDGTYDRLADPAAAARLVADRTRAQRR